MRQAVQIERGRLNAQTIDRLLKAVSETGKRIAFCARERSAAVNGDAERAVAALDLNVDLHAARGLHRQLDIAFRALR
ncbi:hypothetical protein [Paraburkholderia unamae]|uniref:Uncharacterized protein n=1 Tax=Paraburkholderia unamae TaxID=219649 RepID=A0ACC6RLV6_9BURK